MISRRVCVPSMLIGIATAQVASGQAVVTQIATGFAGPVFATAAPGDTSRLYVVEQGSGSTARIRVLRTATGTIAPTPMLTLTGVTAGGEAGLLGMAFHPDYRTNRLFYIDFTSSQGFTVIREYRMRADNPELVDPDYTPRDLLQIDQPQLNHNGGWIAFGPDGYLYIGMGDGGNGGDTGTGHTPETGNAQDLTNNLLGKLLRIDVDRDDFPDDPARNYGIPAGNPFDGVNGDGEIWAYGLRNPWRNSFDRVTGDLWIGDVGQGSREEIDFEPRNTPGRNYGWRCMEGTRCTGSTGCTCNDASLTLPVYDYAHGSGRCTVIGGYVYRGSAIPDLYGKYVFGDYCSGEIWTMDRSTFAVTRMLDFTSAITSFGEDAYGELVFTSSNGKLYQLTRDGGTPPADCNGNGRPDGWDIADGIAIDADLNGIPDDCEVPCPADFDGDRFVDSFDYDAFVACFEAVSCPNGKTADFNGDGFSDIFDYDEFVSAFETGCP